MFRNLGENMYPVLPTKGLENLKNLKTFNNKELKDFPPANTFPRIQLLTLSYAYHCCEFINQQGEVSEQDLVHIFCKPGLKDQISCGTKKISRKDCLFETRFA